MYVCILHAVFNQVVNLHTVNLDSITVRGVSYHNVARLRTSFCILYLPSSVPPSALPSARAHPIVNMLESYDQELLYWPGRLRYVHYFCSSASIHVHASS